MALLDNQTKVNVGTSFYAAAGSGGGGGGGPIINVSTINLQPNGDINGAGSINLALASGGSWSFVSTTSALDGTTPASVIQFGSPDNTKVYNEGLGNDGKIFISTNATSINYMQPLTVNMGGSALGSVSSLQVSSINNQSYPPAVQTSVSLIAPNNNLTYVKGGGTATLFNVNPVVAQHSYRLDFSMKVQGWNASDGLTPSYAPLPQDWIDIYPLGNVAGSPGPVFTTLQMAQVSSINNDWEGTVSCSWKNTAPGAVGIVVNSAPSVLYSTSIEIGAGGYLTDLGAI